MVLQQAWNYLNDAKYEKAIKMCKTYLDSGKSELKIEANKLAALAYYKLKDFDNSAFHYLQVAENLNDSESWFDLSMAYLFAKKFEKSFETFEKAIELNTDSDVSYSASVPNMRFYYMKDLLKLNKYKDAFIQLDELRKIYEEHEITDSTYLYLCGTPEFDDVMKYSYSILEEVKTKKEIKEWYANFSQKMDEKGQDYIALCLLNNK